MRLEVWPKAEGITVIGPFRAMSLNNYFLSFVLTVLVVYMQMRACLTAYII